jgi:hypothetical protein
MERPSPGAYHSLYRPSTFYPCYEHSGSDALVVLIVTETEARFDPPVCAECGRSLMRWDEEE